MIVCVVLVLIINSPNRYGGCLESIKPLCDKDTGLAGSFSGFTRRSQPVLTHLAAVKLPSLMRCEVCDFSLYFVQRVSGAREL